MALETLLADFGLVLIAGTILGFAARQLKQPLIAGYVLAGLLLGPLALGIVEDSEVIRLLSTLGVAFLLFAIGLQIDFSRIMRYGRIVLIGGILQVALTALVFGLASHALGIPDLEALYLGLIIAFSSSVIAVKMLSDARQLNSLEGRLIVGYALVQDLLAVLVLPLLENPFSAVSPDVLLHLGGGLAALVIAGAVLGQWVFPRVAREAAKNRELFFLLTVSSCFLFIFMANALSFPLAVGAFIGGLALGRIPQHFEALGGISHIRDLFGTVFFVSLGLQFHALPVTPLLVLLGLAVFVLNPLVFAGINLAFGFGLRTSISIGLALFQASEFSFILASQGLALGQISQATFDAAVAVILFSMVATPYIVALDRRANAVAHALLHPLSRYKPFFERRIQKMGFDDAKDWNGHIIVAGAGVFGEQLVHALTQNNEVLVLEQDPEIIERMRAQNISAVFCARNNPEVLERAHFENARLLVVTIPDMHAAEHVIKFARTQNANIPIFARAHYPADAETLYDAGADQVILPQVIASNQALVEIEHTLENGKRPRHALEDAFRQMANDKN